MAGFGRLVRAEWTKLRSVRRWVLALAAVVLLSVGFSLFTASSNGTDVNKYPDFVVGPDGRPVSDQFGFVHQALTGDGSITARVVSQDNSHEWAGAGVMVKDGVRSGSRYAAIMVTSQHGVRLSANFSTNLSAGGDGGAVPRWLRLTRAGDSVTGYRSTDGADWHEVGTLDVGALPATVEIGLFVSSPEKTTVKRSAGGVSVAEQPTAGKAIFDNVRVESAQPGATTWTGDNLHHPAPPDPPDATGRPAEPDPQVVAKKRGLVVPSWSESNGLFTVSGSGAIGPREQPDDVVQAALFGVFGGLIVIAALGVLFMTSEFKRGLIRTTFAASPRRGPVLAAKAVVLGATAFGLGLVASVASFLLGLPLLREGGFAPPAFPTPSLAEWPVLRAVVGTAAFVALVALFGLGVGAILRHSAGAITTVLVLLILPTFVAIMLPTTGAVWLMRLTPSGGFAIQRAKPPSDWLAEPWSWIDPWAGIGVVSAYAAVALAVGAWLLRRRDA
ncbi:MAG TPA: ABC transporter permease subunit [Jiangellales bacterium]|nr:ABC transporter permease subunit [Jiangellales bacterium]